MSARLRGPLVALVSGALFGAGLTVSGMVDPDRIIGFLTLGPSWDPTLIFVMAGALAVTLPGFFLLRDRERPWLGTSFSRPPTWPLDRRLLGGAALFGVGWGLAGYCPGPGLVAAGLGSPDALWFVPALLAGAVLARGVENISHDRQAQSGPAYTP